jgi:biotin synthase
MNRTEILGWLVEDRAERLEALWRLADAARRRSVGDEVHLRGLIEISNYCARECLYCGLRAPNRAVGRYRMTADEIAAAASRAIEFGCGTVVLQSGEDYGIEAPWLAAVVRRIKDLGAPAVTLSLGERGDADLAAWREAGADRYLLRFETSNRALYERIHPRPAGRPSDRIAILRRLRQLGYEIGSGVMIGIPGQTYGDLADDIETFRALDLDMIGVGPFLPHPETPLGRLMLGGAPGAAAGGGAAGGAAEDGGTRAPPGGQAPNSELMTYKVVALARLACPGANIPSTTALATVNPAEGRELGLRRGANVVMPNVTPPQYRARYEIYPAKACIYEDVAAFNARLRRRLAAMGRRVGAGPGPSRRAPAGAFRKVQEST